MDDNYIEWVETSNLFKIPIKEKYKYYKDISNIKFGLSMRVDNLNVYSNIFIEEAAQLLINAIYLFEEGYFDCAYYSLRQSIETATTMVYLSDIPDDKMRAERFESWKTSGFFPEQTKMRVFLSQKGIFYSDMKSKMFDYFNYIKDVMDEINKYVHKQGFKNLYIGRIRLYFNQEYFDLNIREEYEVQFLTYLEKCIGIVAMMRLAIDPFPLLLLDEEIYHRTGATLTLPYTGEFIKKYIGEETLNDYKSTEIYLLHYNYLIFHEKQIPCITDIIKHNYVDSTKIDLILSQMHLLDNDARITVLLVKRCSKVFKVNFYRGLLWYYTDKYEDEQFIINSTEKLLLIHDSLVKYNFLYENIFISVLECGDDYIYLQHKEEINSKEYLDLQSIVSNFHKL